MTPNMDALAAQMLDEWVEPFVFGNDVEVTRRISCAEATQIICNREVESILAA